MKTARINLLITLATAVVGFAAGRAIAQQAEPEILPAPPGEIAPQAEGRVVQPAPPLVREEVTLYGSAPLGRQVPMHIRALFESHARGEAQRKAAFANQRYILNHVAWMNGLPSSFGGSLDYAYSGLGGTFGIGGDVFEPWPYVPGDIWGYPFHDTIESPVGHRITWRGPNAYTYEPVYARELNPAAPLIVEDEGWPAPEEGEVPADPAAPPEVEPAGLALVQALFSQQQFADAAATLRDAINDVPREELAAALNAARQQNQLAAGDFTRFLRALEAAIADDRQNSDLRLLLAWQYHLLGHADAAIHQLAQALRIDGNDATASALRDALSDGE